LFWNTARHPALEHDENYRAHLPAALARRIENPAQVKVSRRRVLGGVGAVAAVSIVSRTTGYAPLAWDGRVLSAWEAQVLVAAAEVFLPSAGAEERESLAPRVDRYLLGMPPVTIREVHGMFALIEHLAPPLDGYVHRFTRLSLPQRTAFLDALLRRGGVVALAGRSLRDLCMVGFYQQPTTWPAVGYGGPLVPLSYDPRGPLRASHPRYDALVAKPGTLPKGVVS
jgi:D-cysteine desulfhydrase